MLFTLTPSAPVEGYGEALLSLADAKLHLKIEDDVEEDDPLIEALRDAAIDMVEQYANLRMGPCEGLVATFDGFGARMFAGIGPAWSVAVTGIDYVGSDGVAATIAGDGWRLGARGDVLPAIGTSWPCGGSAVAVTFDVGFPAGQCPPALIAAAKLFLAHLYANREAVVMAGTSGELPLGFTMLCDRFRLPVL